VGDSIVRIKDWDGAMKLGFSHRELRDLREHMALYLKMYEILVIIEKINPR
jgi:hypothetical protein